MEKSLLIDYQAVMNKEKLDIKLANNDICIIPSNVVSTEGCAEWLNSLKYKYSMVNGFYAWYLHGHLETRFAIDSAYMYVNNDVVEKVCSHMTGNGIPHMFLNDGIYNVYVYGIVEKCTGFFWIVKDTETVWRQRGIVVLNSDTESFKEAMELFNNKPSIF